MARLAVVKLLLFVSLAVGGSSDEAAERPEPQLRSSVGGDVVEEGPDLASARSEPQLRGSGIGDVVKEGSDSAAGVSEPKPLGSRIGDVDGVAAQGLLGVGDRAVALALAGGGFRAFSIDVALATGLATVKAKGDGEDFPGLAASKFFQRFGTVSTVSGSTWFLAQLAFSQRFMNMTDRMVRFPESASSEFRAGWMDAWMALGRSDADRVAANSFLDSLSRAGLSFLETDFREISYFWKRGLSWNDFVATLLRRTGDVGSEVLLGSPLTSTLLQGKTWLVGHSVVIGSQKQRAQLNSGFLRSVKYNIERATFEEDLPAILPAKYSVVLGGGTHMPAPVPYLGGDISRGIEYQGSQFFGLWATHETSAPLRDLSRSLTAQAPSLSVAGVASASSAFAGGICLNEALTAAASVLDSEFTPWAALAEGPSAFQIGVSVARDLRDNGVSTARVQATARAGVVGVVDGAYTDNTGVGNAVAAGASEVVVVLNDLPALYSLFQNGLGRQAQLGVPRLHLPIFAGVLEQGMLKDFTQLRIPGGSMFLSQFSTFSIAATTDRSEVFGIEAGRAVQLHVVYVKTLLSIGGLDDYTSYTRLIAEIVSCLTSPDNAKVVKESLIPHFF